MTTQRVAEIRARLISAFEPTELEIVDESHLHIGHQGAKDGRGHFRVTMVSERFRDLNRIQSHRLIYDALGTLMETDIHALSLTTAAPDAD